MLEVPDVLLATLGLILLFAAVAFIARSARVVRRVAPWIVLAAIIWFALIYTNLPTLLGALR